MLPTSVLSGFSDKATSLIILLGKVKAKNTYSHTQLRVRQWLKRKITIFERILVVYAGSAFGKHQNVS